MHNIEYRVYDENVNRNKATKELDAYVRQCCILEGGALDGGIRWYENDICDDYNAAQQFLENHDRKWYDNLAVRYYEIPAKYTKVELTAAYKTLKQRLDDTRQKYAELNDKLFCEGMKSKYVTCKGCGSSLSTEHLKANYCPLCRADMRSQTILNRLDGYKEKCKSLEKEVENERKKHDEKERKAAIANRKHAKIKWLVKFEYHT